VHRVTGEWAEPLGAFLEDLRRAGDEAFFHPHPLTAAQAGWVAAYAGQDLYYVLVDGRRVLGYAMLRGWDAGFAVPSLGIALHPTARGAGLARPFMHFLHAAARRRGATRVRLKVYAANARAFALYRALGYEFAPAATGELVGILTL
jgi:ribosomal protein S18 acetylase RimI-like enzyme